MKKVVEYLKKEMMLTIGFSGSDFAVYHEAEYGVA